MKWRMVLCLLALTAVASADAGTPLMWASCCYLTVANLVVGVFEAAIAKVLLKRKGVSVKQFVIANYASTFAGLAWMLFASYLLDLLRVDRFHWGGLIIIVMWVLSFGLTLVVEWWFIAMATGLPTRSPEAKRVTIWVNLASYAVLVPLSLCIAPVNLYTQTHWAKPGIIAVPKGWVYYVSGKEVRRIRIDGKNDEFVIAKPMDAEYVAVVPSIDGHSSYLAWTNGSNGDGHILMKNLGKPSQAARGQIDQLSLYRFVMCRQFDAEPKYKGVWAFEGIHHRGKWFAAETPFLSIYWYSATMLPNEVYVAQCDKEIVLLDPKRDLRTTLTAGESPSVLLDDPPKANP